MMWYDSQGGEAAVEMLEEEEDKIMLCAAIDEYNNSFILK